MIERIGIELRRGARMSFTALWWCIGFTLTLLFAGQMVAGDSDLVLHIMYGRAVLAGGIPSADPLLYGHPAAPVLQEWLFEILVALLDRAFGLAGPLILSAVLIGSLFAFLFHRMLKDRVSLWVATFYCVFVFFSIKPHLICRPHLLSWWGAAAVLALLQEWINGRLSLRNTLLAGGFAMALWANLHGGFLVGAAVALAVAGGELLQRVTRTGPSRLQGAFLVLSVFALATLANPWGARLHAHIAGFLSNDFLISHTSDFQPPSFEERTAQALALTGVAVWIPLLLRWRHVRARQWLLAAGLTAAALTSVRHIPFLGVLMLPVAARHCQALLESASGRLPAKVLRSSARMERAEQGSRGWLWCVALAALAVAAVGSGLLPVSLQGDKVPTKALKWVSRHSEFHAKPVLAGFLDAGYLLYATPVQQVYLHALNANYPDERLRTWMAIGKQSPGWEQDLAEIQWAFLSSQTPQAETLARAPCWRQIYGDDRALVLEKTCPAENTQEIP